MSNEKITIQQACKLLEELHEFGNIEDEKTFDALKMAIAAMRGNVPDWSHAPEWANYYHRSNEGHCWWYECEPKKTLHRYKPTIGRVALAKVAISIEKLWQRPTE